MLRLAKIKRFIGFHGKHHHGDLVPAEAESFAIRLMLICAIVPERAVLPKIDYDSEHSQVSLNEFACR
jgi:hypothetical protein